MYAPPVLEVVYDGVALGYKGYKLDTQGVHCSCMVDTPAVKGLLYQDFVVQVCTIMVLGPFG